MNQNLRPITSSHRLREPVIPFKNKVVTYVLLYFKIDNSYIALFHVWCPTSASSGYGFEDVGTEINDYVEERMAGKVVNTSNIKQNLSTERAKLEQKLQQQRQSHDVSLSGLDTSQTSSEADVDDSNNTSDNEVSDCSSSASSQGSHDTIIQEDEVITNRGSLEGKVSRNI